MTRFRIDDPAIDVEALERRVEDAIAAKRGKRFTDAELREIRATPLRPRLRREDLPRSFMAGASPARPLLPQLPPSPGPIPGSASQVEVGAGPAGERVDIEGLLHSGSGAGLTGKVQRAMRALFRRLTGFRPEATLVELQDSLRERIDGTGERERERLERAFDLLKENLDRRVDATGDWVGAHLSSTSGRLEERAERELQLLHNLVFELTNAKLDLQHMQDRLNEMARRVQNLEERERMLESMTLGRGSEGPSE